MESTRELSFEELEQLAGGTSQEADDYIQALMMKYGVDTRSALLAVMTSEERELFVKMFFHKPGEPLPGELVS